MPTRFTATQRESSDMGDETTITDPGHTHLIGWDLASGRDWMAEDISVIDEMIYRDLVAVARLLVAAARRSIVSVTLVPSVPVKCIKVDSPSHLFLAGPGMVPTHNTAETEMVALAPKAPWVVEEGQIEGHEEREDFHTLQIERDALAQSCAAVTQAYESQAEEIRLLHLALAAKDARIGQLKSILASTPVAFEDPDEIPKPAHNPFQDFGHDRRRMGPL